ncbi:helix-turn-helix domain-containing protein [Streptantibioticus ferralitis]|uniref:helix-turn-helix domain-containing protein n=1 Tax=Streptantibioticus ferralitis TaxID=236510 RepID=UPI003FD85454
MATYGEQRRVPGLRRDEVARLAGVSESYYIRLEQGTSLHASPEVLDAIARASTGRHRKPTPARPRRSRSPERSLTNPTSGAGAAHRRDRTADRRVRRHSGHRPRPPQRCAGLEPHRTRAVRRPPRPRQPR